MVRVAGVVLAAGASERMGAPKALLRLHSGETFLAASLQRLRAAGCEPLAAVVAEPHGREVGDEARRCGAAVLENPAPERGQISSMRIGIAGCGGDVALVALVDHPAWTTGTARALVEAARKEPLAIHLPVQGGQRGHPVAFPASFARSLAAAHPGESARDVLSRCALPTREVAVDDPGILIDLDTPGELAAFRARGSP